MIYRMALYDNGTFYYDDDDSDTVVYGGINVLEDETYYYADRYPSYDREADKEIITVVLEYGDYRDY